MTLATRKHYAWFTQWTTNHYLTRLLSIATLRKFAQHVWSRECVHHAPALLTYRFPIILARNVPRSYYETNKHEIVLAPRDRCRYVLLHELTHALGYGVTSDHDASFNRRFALLIVRYGRIDPLHVAAAMGAWGLEV